MARLVEALSRFFGRVEILALGLEDERIAAEAALAKGDPLEAREHARAILSSLPDSAVGFALWAEASEDAWLDHETVTALSELAKRVPWRADVWLRLGRAGLRCGWSGAREALERAASAPEERESARLSLLDLCDLDLEAGDPGRAQRWLDRIPTALAPATATEGSPRSGARWAVDREVALRRAECALARGDVDSARSAAAGLLDEEKDISSAAGGRWALVGAQLALAAGDVGRGLDLALRALVLEVRGATELTAALLASSRDVVVVDRVRQVVRAAGTLDEPTWAAAFALAEGRRDDARRALSRGLAAGDRAAAAALLRMAIEARDLTALDLLGARDPALLPPDLRQVREAARLASEGQGSKALEALDAVTGEAAAWAEEIRRSIAEAWIPAQKPEESAPRPAAWSEVLTELRRTARELERLDLAASIEGLAVERERPLRAAVVGEFNAGKSTFLNALLGEDVAPTGVLPTTAALHWVAWAPDPFARVVIRGSQDRVVPHEQLKATLRGLEAEQPVDRVFIYAPIERLKRVEILDTPGFNAPDPDHVLRARQAFDEAHVAIWLLDATGAMKESERRVLAEIQALGVPVQILANKADRLRPDALETVLAHVREGLAETQITSLAPPIAFSAKLSLKGRLGDAEALAASGWSAVEALFSEQIVDASEALRERALRRKAARIAAELHALASARAAEDREAARRARARVEALRASAAYLRRERRALASGIDKALAPTRRVLQLDLRPIAELPDERKRTDPGLRAYVQERLVARLAAPLSAEIAAAAWSAGNPPPGPAAPASPRATSHVRAVLMGMVAVHDAPADLVDRPIEGVIEAAIDAFAMALSAEAEEPIPPTRSTAVELRIQTLADALHGRVRS